MTRKSFLYYLSKEKGHRHGQERMITTSTSYSLVLEAGALVLHAVLKAKKYKM